MKLIRNCTRKMFHVQRGFTLIELLVVVAIIGVLSALLMTNFVGIRQRARDGQRKADLRQIQSALELYRADQGAYPITSNFPQGCGEEASSTFSSGSSVYMKKIPCDALYDPANGAQSQFDYQYVGTTTSYCLRACLENQNDSQKDAVNNDVAGCSFGITCDDGTVSYTLQNP